MKKLILLWIALLISNAHAISITTPGGTGTGSGDVLTTGSVSGNVATWTGTSKTLSSGFPITTTGKQLMNYSSTANTLTGLGIPNHNQLAVSTAGVVTLTTLKAATSAGLYVQCSNGSTAAYFDGGGSCQMTSPTLVATVNVSTPLIAARTSSGLSLKDDGSNLGLHVADGGSVGVKTTSPQYPFSVSSNVGVTGNIYITGDLLNNSHGSRVIHCSGAASSVTGTTDETTLSSWTIPAGAMGANGQLEVIAIFSVSETANNKIYKFTFGGTTYYAKTKDNDNSLKIHLIVQNTNSASSQIGFNQYTFWDTSPDPCITSSVDTTSAVTCTITGQLGNASDTITLVSVMARINK